MATVSVSPTLFHPSAMSSRRIPLNNNPNAANSPLRGASALAQASKRVRSHADIQREEPYGQPPPAKRQMVDQGLQRPSRSPTHQRTTKTLAQRGVSRAATAERASQSNGYKPSEKEVDNVRQWQTHTRARFPKMVFYFDSIPDDQRVKLVKQISHLGAVSIARSL
jgi:regulatory subunit for Cdc7p protein kinase